MKTTRKTDYGSIFAAKLRALLESNSVSMTELAKELGVKQQTVSQWANGATTPDLKNLKPLASYFKISIDELVTGVAPANEEFNFNTGLSNLAIEILKQLNVDDTNNTTDSNNRVIIEFLNVIIESMHSKRFSLSRLAKQCMDYIIGAHNHILEQEELMSLDKNEWEILVHKDRPNMNNDNLDYKTYQLAKSFEYFIEHLAKNPKIEERVRKLYIKSSLSLPDYVDTRFDVFRDYMSKNNPITIKVGVNDTVSEDDEGSDSPD